MRKRYLAGVAAMAAATLAFSGCGGSTNPSASASAPGSAEAVTLEFAQWWEPELPANSLRGPGDQNPHPLQLASATH